MAKKPTVPAAPLTEEEIINNCYKNLSSMHEVQFSRKPNVDFKVGEEVILGFLKNPVIVHLHENGLTCVIKYKELKEKYSTEWVDRYGAWNLHELEKKVNKNTSFAVLDSVLSRVTESNRDLRGLLSMVLKSGVWDSAPYQRDLCWTDKDKTLFLDSIFKNFDIGKFVVIKNEYTYGPNNEYYELVDGKQRMNCILDFYLNKFEYRGYYWQDLSVKDRQFFEQKTISLGMANGHKLTLEEKIELFLAVNTTGVPQSVEHLEKLQQMITYNKEPESSFGM